MSEKVTHISCRRRSDHTLETITFVFGGVHYGTFPVVAPYTSGRPLMLYVVPRSGGNSDGFVGPIDCLVTDEPALQSDIDVAR